MNYEAAPLSPFLNPPVCLQLQDEVEVKTPRTLEGHALVLARCMRFITKNLKQILKFMSEHITALNLVLNGVQPKFSSLLRRVSKAFKIYKFAK